MGKLFVHRPAATGTARRRATGLAMLGRGLAGLFLVGSYAIGGCSTDPESGEDCHDGDQIACPCTNGDNGLASCSGGKYGPCLGCPDGSGGSGGSGGTGGVSTGEGGHAGGGLLPFGAPCADDEECESGLCYPFGNGPRCTIPCPANPDDCPNGGLGCNGMTPSVCKPG